MLGNSVDKQYSAENIITHHVAQVIGEWNMNYYAFIEDIDPAVYGTAEPGYYERYFPLKDVTKGWRPTSGVYKPRFTKPANATADDLRDFKFRTSGYRNSIYSCGVSVGTDTYALRPRLYNTREGQPFKYWDSPYQVSSASFVDPYIDYSNGVWANKISVTFQTVLSRPSDYDIQVRETVGGAWVTKASDITVPDNGVVQIWRNSGGSWTTTPVYDYTNAVKIYGIRLVINAMTFRSGRPHLSGHPSVIEISPRVETDLTLRMEDFSIDMNLAEDDSVLPVGTVSSNSGSITFSNNDSQFEEGLAGEATIRIGDFAKKDGKITVTYAAQTAGASAVPVMVMYTEKPVLSGVKESVTFDLFDRARYMQEQPAPELLIDNITPTAAIWSILDMAGFSNIIVKHPASTTEQKINWFYCSKEETVWDAIQKICASHQYAVYIDESDNVVIMTRPYIYEGAANSFVLTSETVTDTYDYEPNVVSIDETIDEPINSASVTFKPVFISSSYDPDIGKLKGNSQVASVRVSTLELYRPSEPVLLGCAKLARSMNDTQTSMYINSGSVKRAEWGNFSGYLLVDREIIKYDGLEFSYTPKSGAPAGPLVAKSREEFMEIQSYAVGAVNFTGKLANLERGQFGTAADDHYLAQAKLVGWTLPRYVSIKNLANGNSYLSVRSPSASSRRVTASTKVLHAGSQWTNTRMRIDDIKTRQRAGGIVVSATTNPAGNVTSGIYVEIQQGSGTNAGRVAVYTVSGGDKNPTPIVTSTVRVPEGQDFDFSVCIRRGSTSTQRLIYVYVNRTRVIAHRFTTSVALTSRIGLAATGDSSVKFDYVAGGSGILSSEQSKYDGAIKNYISGILDKDRGLNSTRVIPNLESIGFETFDDYVREIFYKEIRFSRAPAASYETVFTSLTVQDSTNKKPTALGKDMAGALSVTSPFGATLAVANVSSRPVVLVNVTGDATYLYPYVYGHVIQEYDEQRVTAKNDRAVMQAGEKKADFSPKWVNNRVAADSVANWIVSIKKDGMRRYTAEVHAGHIIQIGDTVRLNIPEKGIDASVFVTGVRRADGGDGINSTIEMVEL
jgi:hypothetical protein